MTGTLTVLCRELAERRVVLAAAAVAGLLALAAPLLPGVSAENAVDSRRAMAAVFAIAFAVGAAIAHGAAMVGRDLRERRLGFYFARPLSATSIWTGKLLAGVVLAVGAGGIALLPTALTEPDGLADWFQALGVAAVGALFLVAAAHLVSVAIVSRSRLLALDLVALPLLAGAAALLLRRLAATGVFNLLLWAAAALATATLLVVLAAGWAQVAHGRCDPIRGHRVQATVLWGGLAAALLLLGAATAFLVTVGPGSLRSVETVTCGRQGTWVGVQGPAAWRGGYRPAFLLDPATGRSLRLPDTGWRGMTLTLADDGSRAAWLEPVGSLDPLSWVVTTADLSAPLPTPIPTTLVVAGPWPATPLLSPDGRHLVLADSWALRVAVYRLGEERLVATLPLPANATPRLGFVTPERLRVELWRDLDGGPGHGRGELTVGAITLPDGRFETTSSTELRLAQPLYRPLDPAGRRMALVHLEEGRWRLAWHDAWTGAPLATLASWRGAGVEGAVPGRRPDRGDRGRGGRRPAAPVRAGGRAARYPAAGSGATGQPRLGSLTRTAPPRGRLERRLDRVGPTRGGGGDRRPRQRRAHPPRPRPPSGRQLVVAVRRQPPAPGSLPSRLLLGPEGSLELFDPATGTCRRLLGRG